MKVSSKKANPAAPPVDPFVDGRVRLVTIFLVLVTVLIYLPAWFHDFIYFDDPAYVFDNPVVRAGLNWNGFKWAFIGWHASNWHPLTWLSHELDCSIFGLFPGGHHFVSVLLHAANSALLFHLILRLTKSFWPSALVAALFAWHPLHVESVAWVAERKDVLSTFFGLLSLLSFTRFASSRNSATRGFSQQKDWLWAVLFFAFSLMAKPMLVTLPFVFLLLDFWPLGRRDDKIALSVQVRRLIVEKWPFFLLSAISCLITFLAQRGEAVLSLHEYSLPLRSENAVISYATYLFQLFWPAKLAVFYPLPGQFPIGEVALAAAVLVVLSFLAWRTRLSNRYFLIGWLWFLGTLVPVIGLVRVGEQAMADRYMYVPAIGLFVAAAFGLEHLCNRAKLPPKFFGVAAILIPAIFIPVTVRQLGFWTDSEALFSHALAVTDKNGPAHMMLGVALERRGHPEEALQEYQAALDCDDALIVRVAGGEARPLAAQYQLLLGQAAEQKKDLDEAISHYQKALQREPNLVEAHHNLGNLLDARNNPTEALTHFKEAVRLRPDLPLTHESLGTELSKLGRFDEAMREFREADRLAPGDPRPSYLRGKAFLRHGQSQAAVGEFQNALRLDPNDTASLTYLARTFSVAEDASVRNGLKAIELAEKANYLTGGTQAVVLATLATAYAESGRFDDARKTAQSAIILTPGDAKDALANLERQLRLYGSNQPVREKLSGADTP